MTRAAPRKVPFEEVRASLGEPDDMMKVKKLPRLDEHLRRFIAHSPFLSMATADAEGNVDCTPRGDHPGFVRVLDDVTLAIPDRPGNQIADSFRNLASHPGVGLLFFIPGLRETARVNGSGYATDDPEVLARMQAEGRTPSLAIVVRVEEAFLHCGRALLRSRLWDPASQALAEEIPSPGEIAADQFGIDVDPEALNSILERGYQRLY
ncbi:MSMEG_1061 family FMN-dependent PPOX-type flavoprotein [Saccharopolyspora endophytica]|uniref:Pyridoxamine 5'-phosphate oxidase family protein n=1 Tax=Saccharopolyspora endophytica TaxID=543886 RepID=A0ABS5DC54_9PSEU|nr:MSMEG_1061 family FMN-dependent PPOX-type flavoprotein [Saccharopolyspora endophytica]MBQ0923871.1 pyridoxamine 5'-phosphate oxidase family protein [Saccharopolyspora endophytica]